MLTFNWHFHPLTSRPYLSDPSYTEYPPCEALKPYIACFWESKAHGGREERQVLVVPDTCTDIIIEIDRAGQRVTGRLCGLYDRPVVVGQGRRGDVTSFAVRFYFWAFHLFFRVDMREMYNRGWDMELIDPGIKREWEPLFYMESTGERIAWMERYLFRKLDESRYNPGLYNAVDRIVTQSGRARLKEICEYSCVSPRQLERLFGEKVGMSVKRMSCLVRYQNVWGDMVNRKPFSVQEAVYRYGYTDQAHLLNEFKRFHGVTPGEAMRIALDNRSELYVSRLVHEEE